MPKLVNPADLARGLLRDQHPDLADRPVTLGACGWDNQAPHRDRQDAIDHYTAWSAGREDIEFSFLRLFTQPNVPDVRAHLLGQDVILVEGGSVVNLVAVWRAHGLPEILRECWEAGVVLTGASAGSLCWHVGGPTDSFRDNLDPFTGGQS